jgi:RNA polymerase sigma-70 factor (ECF subfamily)
MRVCFFWQVHPVSRVYLEETVSSLTIEDIERLYNRYGPNVLHRCRQLLRDEQAAWDAMHQTFVKAIKYRGSFRGDAEPMTWLFSIATRVCLDELRAKSRGELPELDSTPEPSDEDHLPRSMADRLQQRQTVAKLLEYFNAKVQEIVVLRYFDELEVREISAKTGLSERTVARRLSQFLERSKRLLGDARA